MPTEVVATEVAPPPAQVSADAGVPAYILIGYPNVSRGPGFLGSKAGYGAGLFLWSLFTFLQGFVGVLGSAALVALLVLRFLVGLAEAPSFPGNARIVAAWFPTRERGTTSAIFNSAQYFATVLFAPLMGFLVYRFGWPWVFWVMGPLGMALVLVWQRVIHAPRSHPAITAAELDELERGGALIDLDGSRKKPAGPRWAMVSQLFRSRMMLGVYLAQYCINTITYFFLTWFPVYLVKGTQAARAPRGRPGRRGMTRSA